MHTTSIAGDGAQPCETRVCAHRKKRARGLRCCDFSRLRARAVKAARVPHLGDRAERHRVDCGICSTSSACAAAIGRSFAARSSRVWPDARARCDLRGESAAHETQPGVQRPGCDWDRDDLSVLCRVRRVVDGVLRGERAPSCAKQKVASTLDNSVRICAVRATQEGVHFEQRWVDRALAHSPNCGSLERPASARALTRRPSPPRTMRAA